jgi:hypothetical protein
MKQLKLKLLKKPLKLPIRPKKENAQNRSSASRKKNNAVFKMKRTTPELSKKLNNREGLIKLRGRTHRPSSKLRSKSACSSCRTELVNTKVKTNKSKSSNRTSVTTVDLRENSSGKLKR